MQASSHLRFLFSPQTEASGVAVSGATTGTEEIVVSEDTAQPIWNNLCSSFSVTPLSFRLENRNIIRICLEDF